MKCKKQAAAYVCALAAVAAVAWSGELAEVSNLWVAELQWR